MSGELPIVYCAVPILSFAFNSTFSMEILLVRFTLLISRSSCRFYWYVGYFAVKKVAVGQSHSYLLSTLREVCGTQCRPFVPHSYEVCRFVSSRSYTTHISSHITIHGSNRLNSQRSDQGCLHCSKQLVMAVLIPLPY